MGITCACTQARKRAPVPCTSNRTNDLRRHKGQEFMRNGGGYHRRCQHAATLPQALRANVRQTAGSSRMAWSVSTPAARGVPRHQKALPVRQQDSAVRTPTVRHGQLASSTALPARQQHGESGAVLEGLCGHRKPAPCCCLKAKCPLMSRAPASQPNQPPGLPLD